MCLRIFVPTPRRVLLFLIFLLFTLSGILNIVYPFQQLFGLPYLLLSDYAALIAQVIYSYIVACIYAFSYVWLEANIRRRYPHMNDLAQKWKLKSPATPQTEEPASKQEAQPIHKPLPHAKIHARIKKAVRHAKR